MSSLFKSSSIRLYFITGNDGEKDLKKSKNYANLNETATLEEILDFKDRLTKMTNFIVVDADLVVTKSL